VPTGVAIRDVREQLFAAAERILLRDGPNALTSRAVTAEAGVAKGVLHRHFADFDAFLVELVLDRIGRVEDQGRLLLASVGVGTVENNLTGALTELFGSVATEIVSLVTARDELRERLRRVRPGGGVPVLAEGIAIVSAYLAGEKDAGRIPGDSDVRTLAHTLIGAAQLLYAGREVVLIEEADLRRIVTTIVRTQ
jgi:AcrR family transcriptional regulator